MLKTGRIKYILYIIYGALCNIENACKILKNGNIYTERQEISRSLEALQLEPQYSPTINKKNVQCQYFDMHAAVISSSCRALKMTTAACKSKLYWHCY